MRHMVGDRRVEQTRVVDPEGARTGRISSWMPVPVYVDVGVVENVGVGAGVGDVEVDLNVRLTGARASLLRRPEAPSGSQRQST